MKNKIKNNANVDDAQNEPIWFVLNEFNIIISQSGIEHGLP